MSIASELQDKINSKAAIKAAIEAKGVTVGDVKLNQYAEKVDAIAQDPSIPVGTGQHLVTFYDFDGKVLKRQRVNTGDDAIAPDTPIHQYLTFAEWNNPFTNVQSDIDTGAIYNTTDGKTYLFITLTPVTGLAPTLFFSKSSASLMTIDWGDGTTSTSTTPGNQNINHVYATAGDYIITIDNSAGGTWSFGNASFTTTLFFGYANILNKIYFGSYVSTTAASIYSHRSLEYISFGNKIITILNIFGDCTNLKHVNICAPTTFTSIEQFVRCTSLKKICIYNIGSVSASFLNGCYLINKIVYGNGLTTIAATAFNNCYSVVEYIFLSTTPPTLANVNAFTGINPICKIYVPDASVEAYKAATNWNNYANYIYPLSSKPQSDE